MFLEEGQMKDLRGKNTDDRLKGLNIIVTQKARGYSETTSAKDKTKTRR